MGVTVMFIGLLIIGPLVAGVVALIVLLIMRSKQTPQTVAPRPARVVSHEGRQAILKKLADGELTKTEAEEQLTQLGSPVPEAMPATPPVRSGASKGCLITAIIAIILPLGLIILVLLLSFA